MHHKRKRPKNRRAGCLLCKPWKACNMHFNTHTDEKRRIDADQQLREVEHGNGEKGNSQQGG